MTKVDSLSSPLEEKSRIAVAATFTADAVRHSIEYWIGELELPASVEFAPYNQVLLQLLDPASLFAENRRGLNVVLLRLEDLRCARGGESRSFSDGPESEREIEANLRALLATLRSAASGSGAPYLICIGAPAPTTNASFFSEMEELTRAELAGLSGVHLITAGSLSAMYPVADYYDAESDKLGHVPYSSQYFSGLGTTICRTFDALTRAPYKVIALDCDQTLWSGVCGEDGAAGISLDLPRRRLQEFMCAQREAGMLLCICSKNTEEDVAQVFDRRSDMPLRRAHIAAWRVNWRSKSENLKSLAVELQLGLDSFIFVDDNPMECAEVRANCRECLVLPLPSDVAKIPAWLSHVWAFDHLRITEEDRQRTAMWLQNRRRDELQATSQSLSDFIAGLELKIEITGMTPDQLPRVTQLTTRTNQFNFTTRRRSESDIQQLLSRNNLGILTAKVSDRFGEYGLVGVVIYELTGDSLEVDTFLLSCRVLGKGVEHRILARLGEIAIESGMKAVRVPFLTTAKNKPARTFLDSVGEPYRAEIAGGFVYDFPADAVAALRFDPQTAAAPRDSESRETPLSKAASGASSRSRDRASELALMSTDVKQILKAVESSRGWHPGATRDFKAPDTELQRQLAGIWQHLLRVDRIGIRDDYFDLGGDSLLAVQLFSQVHKLTGKQLPMVTLFEAPTIEKLAAILSRNGWQAPWQSLVPIKPGGSRPPFYCVHGVGGNILEYLDLAKYMDQDQPFYGIQALGLDGKQPNLTVEEMAAHYIEEVVAFQPRGPYYLGGSSFGGLVAYEMARQLHAQGASIAFLALFDTNGPGYPALLPTTTVWRHRVNRLRERVSLHWSNFLVCEPRQRPGYILEKARRWKNQRIDGTIERCKQLRDAAQDRYRRLFWTKAIREVNRAGHWAAGDYIAPEYDGHVTLFRATEQPREIVADRALGWGPLVKGGLEIIDTPGHHGAIVRDPRARVLAGHLAKCLRLAQSDEAARLIEETAQA